MLAREYNLLFFTDREETRLAETRTWLAPSKFFLPHRFSLGSSAPVPRRMNWCWVRSCGPCSRPAGRILKSASVRRRWMPSLLSIGLKTIILTDETEDGMDMPAGTIKATNWKKMEQQIGKIAGL